VVDLDGIKAKFQRNEFELSQHAVDQTLLRQVTVQELREAVAASEVIEATQPTDMGQVVFSWALRPQLGRFTFKSAIPPARLSGLSPSTSPTRIDGSIIVSGGP
jgi:hypothetical protein